jgi:hypothetical protein
MFEFMVTSELVTVNEEVAVAKFTVKLALLMV